MSSGHDNIALLNLYLFTTNFNGTYPENVNGKKNDNFWILFIDRSQLVMTIIGIIANIVTFMTLTTNGQVSNDNSFFFTGTKNDQILKQFDEIYSVLVTKINFQNTLILN